MAFESLTYVGTRHRAHSPRPIAVWKANDGSFEVVYVPNTKRLKALTDPCPRCLYESGPLRIDQRALLANLTIPPASGVYEIADLENRICQIGSGDLQRRVAGRLAATSRGRIVPDSIWWLYDMVKEGRLPRLGTLPFHEGEHLEAAEDRWRDLRRGARWQVSSAR